MTWLIGGVTLGLILPWFIMGSRIKMATEKRGVAAGFWAWLGGAAITVPLMIGIQWIVHLVL